MKIGQITGLEDSRKYCRINTLRKMGKYSGYFSYEFCEIYYEPIEGTLRCNFNNDKNYDYEAFENRTRYSVDKNEIKKIGDF